MANRYDSFEMFMVDVVEKANSLVDLNEIFDVSSRKVIDVLLKLIAAGWWLFIAVAALLVASPWVFGVSLGSFLLTPPGMIIGGILGIAAVAVMRDVYRNKQLPLAIKDVGEYYKPKYNAILSSGNNVTRKSRIDALLKEAVSALVEKAKRTPSMSGMNALNAWLNE